MVYRHISYEYLIDSKREYDEYNHTKYLESSYEFLVDVCMEETSFIFEGFFMSGHMFFGLFFCEYLLFFE
jgi:hypothetical protein